MFSKTLSGNLSIVYLPVNEFVVNEPEAEENRKEKKKKHRMLMYMPLPEMCVTWVKQKCEPDFRSCFFLLIPLNTVFANGLRVADPSDPSVTYTDDASKAICPKSIIFSFSPLFNYYICANSDRKRLLWEELTWTKIVTKIEWNHRRNHTFWNTTRFLLFICWILQLGTISNSTREY